MNTPTMRPAKRQRLADDDIDGTDFAAAQALPPCGTNSNAARPPPPAASAATPRPAPSRPAPPTASPSRPPPAPANIFGERAIPDVHRQIADFIYMTLNEHRPPLALDAPVEIEAKLGRIIDKRTGQRLALPVRSETVVVDATELRFESDMTVAQHKAFNGVLNQLVQRGKLRYRHSKEIDVFYRKSRDNKVRVTLEGKSRQVLPGRTITKHRLASLDVYCPSAPLDYRISINLEIPTKIPTEVIPDTRERHKDRLSYTHELVQVDLTQVTIKVGPNDPNPQLSHELEVLPGRTITKHRLASLDVYCPSAPLDYRISINLEIPTKIPTEVIPDTRERHKDRLSYTHELVQVDLTQVTIKVGPNDPNPQLSHELEGST
ncbi:hypothetical protein AMAG_16483 [Allomyces macrogynus ATCC 38327]|uniref:mRNA-capping enzyme subunit beta n=1 Tax=Allomyces macrogynus (strain ATCC 38327) TaxID=578462 RepID=A0A0L0TCK2_ALLM3|nr:hypothetical protein AMAG_16483 [Allomyces macrogynus ATCC 38327]|eukprot:KNE72436.1 hypothetical protein AMAG_16483 [Allomyces macrogynus ATCC 38327]